jgi:thioredoxin 1
MSDIKVLKFFGTWCGPCKVLAPQIEAAKELCPEVEFQDVDVDQQPEIAGAHGVMGVPAVVFLKDGEEVSRFVGFRPAEQIKEIIDSL